MSTSPSDQPCTDTYDLAVIGGGIVGAAVALEFSSEARAVLLEAEDRLAAHQTGRNSGVVHSGLYYRPGSLKARLCVEGRRLLYEFCARESVPVERCGKLVVATDEAEVPRLAELHRRGQANGLEGLRWLGAAELPQYEPHVRGVAGLWVPQTGIVDFSAVAAAMARRLVAAGGAVRLSCKLKAVRAVPGGLVLRTSGGEVRCRALINCAGLHCDRVARLCGLRPSVRIIPFRGEYYRLSPSARHYVRNLIYPVPDPRFPFLGVHFTRMISGGVEAGPNAVLALGRHGYRWGDIHAGDLLGMLCSAGFWRMACRHWRTGVAEVHRSLSRDCFVRSLRKLVPAIGSQDLEPGGSGVRAQAVDEQGRLVDDFVVMVTPRMLHVLNAPSPAATASLAIARHIRGIEK